MKKRLLAILLAVVMLVGMATTASAYTTQQYRAADALYHLGLFRGTSETSKEFTLDRELRRDEGTIMLVRMLGKENEAKAIDKTGLPFDDIPSWDEGHIAYAYKSGIVNGMKTDDYVFFGPSVTMEEYMFLTLALRALGYVDDTIVDKGSFYDFIWNKPYTLACQLGLIESTEKDTEFTRGDAVLVFWNALKAEVKGTGKTLAETLMNDGVFTAAEYSEAKQIIQYGIIIPPATPSEPEPTVPPVVPSNPVDPDDGNDNTEPSEPEDDGKVTYEEYQAMTGEEQMEFFESFADPMEFFDWLEKAKAEYEAENPSIEIGGDGNVDLGDLIGGN